MTTASPSAWSNLLKFKDKAEYPEDHELHGKDMSGAEAYDLWHGGHQNHYGFGRRNAFFGDVQRLMLGEVEELWDQVAIAKYEPRSYGRYDDVRRI